MHRNRRTRKNQFKSSVFYLHWSCRREERAQLTQAGKEGLRFHSSEGQNALWKFNALFSSEQRKPIRSSVFRNASPSNLTGYLHEGNMEHLLNKARSDSAKQEFHVESLNMCSGELQRQTEKQNLAFTRRTIRICRISTRTSSSTRRIIYL